MSWVPLSPAQLISGNSEKIHQNQASETSEVTHSWSSTSLHTRNVICSISIAFSEHLAAVTASIWKFVDTDNHQKIAMGPTPHPIAPYLGRVMENFLVILKDRE